MQKATRAGCSRAFRQNASRSILSISKGLKTEPEPELLQAQLHFSTWPRRSFHLAPSPIPQAKRQIQRGFTPWCQQHPREMSSSQTEADPALPDEDPCFIGPHGYTARYATSAQLVKLSTPIPDPGTAGEAAANGDLARLKEAISSSPTASSSSSSPRSKILDPDSCGNIPLIWAADRGHLEVCKFLLDFELPAVSGPKAAQLFHRGHAGSTAFLRAVRGGHLDIVRLFFDTVSEVGRGGGLTSTAPLADAEKKAACAALGYVHNEKLQYPMHFATYKQHKEVLTLMMERGCDTTVLDRKGRTPAEDTKSEEIREMVLAFRQGCSGPGGGGTSS